MYMYVIHTWFIRNKAEKYDEQLLQVLQVTELYNGEEPNDGEFSNACFMYTVMHVPVLQIFFHVVTECHYASVRMRRRHTVVNLCVSVYLSISYLDLQDCCKLSAGKHTTAIKRYFKKSNSLRFKALFFSYGVICWPRTLLWHIPDFPDDQSARSGSLCILTLGSVQQLQLLTAKLRIKHATLANWI